MRLFGAQIMMTLAGFAGVITITLSYLAYIIYRGVKK